MTSIIVRRTLLIMKVAAVLLGGFALTIAALSFAFGGTHDDRMTSLIRDAVSLPLVFFWYVAVFGGTKVLPDSVTAPYDELGHPALHVAGIVANSVYLGALAYGTLLAVKRLVRRKSAGA